MVWGLSTAAQNAAINGATALMNGGVLSVYSGTRPATPNTALSGNTLLASFAFAATAFGSASGGAATAAALPLSVCVATGTASFVRCYESDGATVVGDADVGTDIAFPSNAFVLNESVGCGALRMTSWPETVTDVAGEYANVPHGIVLPDGRVFAVYRKGPGPLEQGKGVLVSKYRSAAGVWSAEAVLFTDPDPTLGCTDPCVTLLANGNLIVSYFVTTWSTQTAIPNGCRVIQSRDLGVTWGAPVTVPSTYATFSACSAPVVELSDHSLLLPIYGNKGNADGSRVVISTDGGATWPTEITIAEGDILNYDFDEPNIILLGNGTLYCLIRTSALGSTSSLSTDHGQTWSAPVTQFSDLDSSPHMCLYPNGDLVVAYRPATVQMTSVRKSTNSGTSWGLHVVIANIAGESTYGAPMPRGPTGIGVLFGTILTSVHAIVQYLEMAESAT